MWLSLVERHVRDVEAVGSSPVTSTSVTLDPISHWVQRRFLFAQLCVAQLCSALRTKALQWVKVPMRDAGLNFALGSALFISSAQLCVAQLCSVHRTKALQWVKVPMRDAGSKVALDSALFLCLFSDEGAAYAYFCRTEMHEVHKKGRKAAFLFIGPVGKYLTTALLYDTI